MGKFNRLGQADRIALVEEILDQNGGNRLPASNKITHLRRGFHTHVALPIGMVMMLIGAGLIAFGWHSRSSQVYDAKLLAAERGRLLAEKEAFSERQAYEREKMRLEFDAYESRVKEREARLQARRSKMVDLAKDAIEGDHLYDATIVMLMLAQEIESGKLNQDDLPARFEQLVFEAMETSKRERARENVNTE